mmetsp:Transcript_48901/g.113679  ORF Transcript_48901/g.113679 Transcript_48901/m.113679 type:complete len:329 (-) Transcript_48901:55-1041(-)
MRRAHHPGLGLRAGSHRADPDGRAPHDDRGDSVEQELHQHEGRGHEGPPQRGRVRWRAQHRRDPGVADHRLHPLGALARRGGQAPEVGLAQRDRLRHDGVDGHCPLDVCHRVGVDLRPGHGRLPRRRGRGGRRRLLRRLGHGVHRAPDLRALPPLPALQHAQRGAVHLGPPRHLRGLLRGGADAGADLRQEHVGPAGGGDLRQGLPLARHRGVAQVPDCDVPRGEQAAGAAAGRAGGQGRGAGPEDQELRGGGGRAQEGGRPEGRGRRDPGPAAGVCGLRGRPREADREGDQGGDRPPLREDARRRRQSPQPELGRALPRAGAGDRGP